MTTPAEDGLRRWHEVVAAKDAAALPDLVAAEAVFHSPAMFKPQEGRDLVVAYLGAALRVLGVDFHYERSWANPTGAVLEFRSVVGGREIHGVDIIEFAPDGTISDFTVMVRPMSALTTLVEHMGAELARMSG